MSDQKEISDNRRKGCGRGRHNAGAIKTTIILVILTTITMAEMILTGKKNSIGDLYIVFGTLQINISRDRLLS